MTTRDKRRARAHKRKLSTGEDSASDVPLYNEENIRHNERIIRENMQRDRQQEPMKYRREGHQQIPTERRDARDKRDMPNLNEEGMAHNKRVVEENRRKDKEANVSPEELEIIEKRRNALKQLMDFFNTKV